MNPLNDYEIVQLGESDWGIQYADGLLIRDYLTRNDAIAAAIIFVQETPYIPIPNSDPRNLEEALVYAQETRDEYRAYIATNQTATEEDKAARAKIIADADAKVAEYQRQETIAQEQIALATEAKLQKIDSNMINLQNARTQSLAATKEAVRVRNDETATPEQKREAQNKAFQAEAYFRSIEKETNQRLSQPDTESVAKTNTSANASGQRDILSAGGQVANINTDITGARAGDTTVIKDTLSNEFGSIVHDPIGNNTVVSGYGTSRAVGTTIYDTSVGVTTVASGADQRIKLSPKPTQESALFSGILAPLKDAGGLVFPYTPTIEYSSSVNYNPLTTVHANQDWHIYQNTPSIDITIQGLFTAQNETEAKYLLAAIHFLRAISKMHFGTSEENKGLPPPQVFLNGYGTYMFNNLSVILKNYNIGLPDNVDYVNVKTGNGESKVPAVTTLSVLLTVQQTPAKARTFNWDSFASGSLMQQKGWL